MSRKESKKKSKAKIKKCGSERNAIIVKHKYLIKLNNIEKKKTQIVLIKTQKTNGQEIPTCLLLYRIFQTSFDKGFAKVSVSVWISIHFVLKSLHFWKSWHAWTAVGGHAFSVCQRGRRKFQKQGRNSKAKFRGRKKSIKNWKIKTVF